jgi:D-galactarolactone cycloisomerase
MHAESLTPAETPFPLREHRITGLEVRPVRLRYPRLVGKNARLGVHGMGPEVQVVILRTDQGATGFAAGSVGRDGPDALRERVRGLAVSDLIDPARGILDPCWKGLDLALHDLAGRILGMPVYAMLGGAGALQTPCYSGMIYFDDLEPEAQPAGIDSVLANTRWDVEHGYRQVKVKIGRGNRWMTPAAGLQRDIEVTRAIRDTFPGVQILVDGNNGFSAEGLIDYLEGIGDVELYWIEEPFQEERAPLLKLREFLNERKSDARVADGEDGFDKEFLLELAAEGLVQVFLPDLEGYGFSAWRQMMPELAARGIHASPHTWGSYLRTCYTAHLAAGIGNVLTIEGVTSTSDDIDLSGYSLKDGYLTPPSAPGFGMALPD